MTGPDLPRGPIPNAIGEFVIGESPIGTQPPFDIWDTILSQYANSPIIVQLIQNFFSYVDQTANLDDFFDKVWNLDTAEGYGLDVWGRIVGVNRVLQITVGKWFGFAEMGTLDADPFGQSAMWSGTPLTENFFLSDQSYRTLILTKAAANITSGSIPAINRMLMTLFPNRGNAYVTEGNPPILFFGFAEQLDTVTGFNQAAFFDGSAQPRMTMTYTFNFALSPSEQAIVLNSGVLPKPTGVKASVVQFF